MLHNEDDINLIYAPFKNFKKILKKLPDKSDILYNLGNAYIKQIKEQEAMECFQEYLKIFPRGPKAEEIKKYLRDYVKNKKTLSS